MCLVLTCAPTWGQVASDTFYLEEGVHYWYIKPGKGKPAGSKATIWLRYTVRDQAQNVLDASGEEGVVVKLSEEGWIRGWQILLPHVQKSSTIGAMIPSLVAYGSSGQTNPQNAQLYLVPPNTDLWFELEILSIK
jgi:FKBP-type peptidyl-prolyl cis-trans isomerase